MPMNAPMPQDAEQPAVHTVDGNRLTLLADGPRGLDALMDVINGARETLDVLYYIFWDDEAGRQVLEALVAARDQVLRVSGHRGSHL